MRRYLKEFLSDRRVIETPRLALVADPQPHHPDRAPAAEGPDYDSIWNKERNEGPLRRSPASQAEQLADAISRRATARIVVDWAMRYGNPSIADAHQGAAGPGLRPHPAGAALSAILRRDHGDRLRQGLRGAEEDALAAGGAHRAALARRPGLYRGAGRDRCRRKLAELDFEPDVIVASFHGVPQEYLAEGRPLSLPVPEDGAAAARDARAGTKERFMICFQSRFGPAEWLKPYLDRHDGRARRAGREEGRWSSRPASRPTASRRSRRSKARTGALPAPRRREVRLRALPQRQRRSGMDVIADVVERELQGWV